ncbi:MAG: aspartate--ammonia ligase [Oscillospiraceae bacterium]|nr:aspartate--ammonia ligase [Oscillospiraceae bacterium]
MIENYRPRLNLYETQSAIGFIKQTFQFELSRRLHLMRATAPLFVDPATGLNDDLSGIERPVSFDIPGVPGVEQAQVVHSLAKWKRQALGEYGFQPDTGLWTDMNAIRRDEEPDALHSIYVDQWDWEKVITADMRTEAELRRTVTDIVDAICSTLSAVKCMYPQIRVQLSREVSFVTAQELENLYPTLSGKERENAYVREHPTTFIIGIGAKLRSGKPHDGRAPDYDDWSLNGDLMFWDETLQQAVELSSMGIRVDADAMRAQCAALGCENRLALPFHQGVLNGTLPLSMGGGIGQSRLCMLLLGKAHIGEVQVSLWPKEMREECAKKNIVLL